MLSQKPLTNALQPIDTNTRTNRRYTILGSSGPASKDRLSIGVNNGGDQRRRASVVPKAHPTPRRVSMLPGTGTTTKSPGRTATANTNNKSRLSMVGTTSTYVLPSSALPVLMSSARPTPGGTLGNQRDDPRPTKNKQYIAQTVLRIMDFLESHDYPHKITPEALQNGPSNKEFQQVFEFLMQCIDRDFKLNIESKDKSDAQPIDVIPQLYKQLGYPFLLSKSVLTSAGAPTTWPGLLAALNWLRELIEFEEIASSGENLFERHIPNKLYFDFLTKSYELFLQADTEDDIQALEDEFAQVVQEQKETLEQAALQKREHKQNLAAEIERLKRSEKRPEALRQYQAMLEKDIDKYETYIRECQGIETKLDQQHEALLLEQDKKTRDLESALGSVDMYTSQLASQELKQTDVERIKLESAQIAENLKQVNSKRLAAENRVWNKNLEVMQSWDRLEKLAQEYTVLQLIPCESEDHVDFALAIGTMQDPHLSNDLAFIREHLQPLMEEYRNVDKKAFANRLTIQDNIAQLQEKQTELVHKVKQLEIEQDRLCKQRVSNKTELEIELASYYEQKEQVDFEQQRIQLEARHNGYGQALLNKLEMVVEMKTRVQQQLVEFKMQLGVVFDNIVI